MNLKFGFISADDHIVEHPEVWTSRLSKAKWGDRIPHIEREKDGSDCWVIGNDRFPLPEIVSPVTDQSRSLEPKDWAEVPKAAYSATDRLTALDADGTDVSVLYPMAAGIAGQVFGRLDDPGLELAC